MSNRIVVLKGDILESVTIENKIVICTETTCSNSSRTFKAVDINSGDILELKYIDYRKSNSNKLYNKKELVEIILLSEMRIYKKVLRCGADFKRTVEIWNNYVVEQLENKSRIDIDLNYNRVLR
jgi:hypothetical protein